MNQKGKSAFVKQLCTEIELQKEYLKGDTLSSIYFGGGTPSLLLYKELSEILSTINSTFQIDEGAEVTLEINPDDITNEKMQGWKELGINRLSIGIQSFRDEDLKWMNRAHNSQEALKAMGIAQNAGINNLSIDLIYGIPGLTNEAWIQNIQTALKQNPTHLSCYSLTVEEKTPLSKLISQGKYQGPKEAASAEQFGLLMDLLEKEGWIHYEISNFCKPGFEAVHNTNYWKEVPYLGLGPSAHSYNIESRQWNIAHNRKYGEAIDKGVIPFSIEILNTASKVNDYILTSLRTKYGCNLDRISELDSSHLKDIVPQIDEYLKQDYLVLKENSIYLTRRGKFVADNIASDLFLVQDD